MPPSAVAGEVGGNDENRVGDQQDRSAGARRSAGPQNERGKSYRYCHGREFDGAEAEGKRLEAPRDESYQGYYQAGDLGACGQRDLGCQLDPAPSRQQYRAPVLRRVSDDRNDHERDEELREVRRVCKGPQRADERFADQGGHDRRNAEHHEGGRQRPAGAFVFSGPEELPLAAQRVPGHGHADDQKQYGHRKRELGERAAFWIAVEPRRGGDEHENGSESDQAERDVGRSAIDEARLAEEKGEAEDEQQVAGDRAYERRPDDRGQAPGHGDDRNDQLRRVTERRVQEAADPGTGMAGKVVRRLADQPRQRDQAHASKHEQFQLADSVEPGQNNDERRHQQHQHQQRTVSDVSTGPAHTVKIGRAHV